MSIHQVQKIEITIASWVYVFAAWIYKLIKAGLEQLIQVRVGRFVLMLQFPYILRFDNLFRGTVILFKVTCWISFDSDVLSLVIIVIPSLFLVSALLSS